MKKYILILLLVLASMFSFVNCNARSFDIPPIHYNVSSIVNNEILSNISSVLKNSNLIEETPEEEGEKRNSFWKLFAIAITVLLIVLFL